MSSSEDLRYALSADTRTDFDIAESIQRASIPCLTVLYHDDTGRIGEESMLTQLPAGRPVSVSRLEPSFIAPGAKRRPLADLHLSRAPLTIRALAKEAIEIDTSSTSTPVAIDGQPVKGALTIDAERLGHGVILQLAESVVLLLHRRDPVPNRGTRHFDLVGDSDEILRLRRDIERVAQLDVPVLLRGETGTGKEMVARALHAYGVRARGPLVTVNMAAVPSSLAASELFGAERGAYTGAERPRQGYFEQADGGTLFLDEIGETPDEIQPLLLRALESGEIQRVGAGSKRTVDVRLIAATDAKLEQRVSSGDFRAPLLHRLAGFDIRLPPLRDRRDDLGRLVRHFAELSLAEQSRDRDKGRLDLRWLRGSLFTRLALHEFPGNVRQLKNVVHQLSIIASQAAPGEMAQRLEELLSAESAPRPESSATASAPSISSEKKVPHRRPTDIDEEELIAALRENGFRILPTARALGLSRTSLYHMIERSSRLRKPVDFQAAELEAAAREHGGDARKMAAALEISQPGLEQRLRQLDLLDLLR